MCWSCSWSFLPVWTIGLWVSSKILGSSGYWPLDSQACWQACLTNSEGSYHTHTHTHTRARIRTHTCIMNQRLFGMHFRWNPIFVGSTVTSFLWVETTSFAPPFSKWSSWSFSLSFRVKAMFFCRANLRKRWERSKPSFWWCRPFSACFSISRSGFWIKSMDIIIHRSWYMIY